MTYVQLNFRSSHVKNAKRLLQKTQATSQIIGVFRILKW